MSTVRLTKAQCLVILSFRQLTPLGTLGQVQKINIQACLVVMHDVVILSCSQMTYDGKTVTTLLLAV